MTSILGLLLRIPTLAPVVAAAPVTAPAAPTSLTAAPTTTSNIALAWTDAATNEDNYKVYRSTNGTDYTLIDTIAADSASYNDATITAGVNYWYKVSAYNTAGEAFSDVVQTNTLLLSLSAWWRFEESSDGSAPVARVDAVGGLSLTDVNTTPSATGKIGNCIDAEADSSESLWCAHNAALGVGDFDFAYAFWYNLESQTATRGVFTKGSGADPNVYAVKAYFDTSARLQWRVSNGTNEFFVNQTGITTGGWHLAILWYTASDKKVRVQHDNGTVGVSSSALTGSLLDSASFPFRIAATSSNLGQPTLPYDGSLDEFMYWKGRIPTADERTALYNSGNGLVLPLP